MSGYIYNVGALLGNFTTFNAFHIPLGTQAWVWVEIRRYSVSLTHSSFFGAQNYAVVEPNGPVLMGVCGENSDGAVRITAFIDGNEAMAAHNHQMLFGVWTY
jgi:hypothetical protein